MPDIEKINRDKERILSIIRINGPSLPVYIAKSVDISPLFTSAFLSELNAEKKLKMSNMKVGSSPLYLIPGQENLLENFTQHLNGREQDALSLLKSKKVLNDQEQEPVIRVALRSIKDFAIPVKVRMDKEEKMFWRYFTLEESEIKSLIQNHLSPSPEPESKPSPEPRKEEIVQEKPEEVKEQEESKLVKKEISQEIPKPEKEPEPEQQEQTEQIEPKEEITPKTKKKAKIKIHEFPENIKEHLTARDIEILESISEKKKEFVSKIRIDTLFGKQEYYLIAKDKKKINENDLTLALQKAQNEKMPALILTKGELDKKAKVYLKNWQNLIKFEKLNF